MTFDSKENQNNPLPIKLQIEALLFAADESLSLKDIRACLPNYSAKEILKSLEELSRSFENRAFELHVHNEKYQLRTKIEYGEILKKRYAHKPRPLSKSALETLAIIAYKQPVTRAQISTLRQVESASIIQNLKDKGLIYASGFKKEIGNPIEYKTTEKFLDVYSLNSLEDLPKLHSLQMNHEERDRIQKNLSLLEENKEENSQPQLFDEAIN